MPLDAARAAFGWLVAGPRPMSVDGRGFPGLPDRRVPLDELRERLLRRRCPQPVRDAVWAHLVRRSREEGGAWTVGCVGVALPALTGIAAKLTSRLAGDPRDVHAAVLAGFLAELAVIDLGRPRIMLRLRWAAYRSGHTCLRECLDAPTPSPRGFGSSAPPPPAGHPDLVLARAIAAGAITAAEAELIGSTRLEEVSLVEAAARRGTRYEAAKKARQRAERRLVDFVRGQLNDLDEPAPGHPYPSRSVTVEQLSSTRRRRVRRRMSPDRTHGGVQVRGQERSSPVPDHPRESGVPRSAPPPAGRHRPGSPDTSTHASPDAREMPRCA